MHLLAARVVDGYGQLIYEPPSDKSLKKLGINKINAGQLPRAQASVQISSSLTTSGCRAVKDLMKDITACRLCSGRARNGFNPSVRLPMIKIQEKMHKALQMNFSDRPQHRL